MPYYGAYYGPFDRDVIFSHIYNFSIAKVNKNQGYMIVPLISCYYHSISSGFRSCSALNNLAMGIL